MKIVFLLLQVRWNACYAFGNIFRNPFLPTGTASWTVSTLFSISFLVLPFARYSEWLHSFFYVWYVGIGTVQYRTEMIPIVDGKWFALRYSTKLKLLQNLLYS